MIVARWVAVAFAAIQVTIYDTMPYPDGLQLVGYVIVAVLAVGNLLVWRRSRQVATISAARRLAVAALAFDVAIGAGIVWLYGFDAESSLYLVLFILPAEGALKFAMPGALATWAASAALYAGREVWAAGTYGHQLSIVSIHFRMGVLLIVSLIIGGLARNLARRTAELRESITELEVVEAWREALIDMLAHDIRSPVGGASSTLAVISQRADRLTPELIRELADSAMRQNRRALRLADDLLDVARARQGRLTLSREEVDVSTCVQQVLTELGNAGSDVENEVPEGLRATVDPARLEQILANLLSNAFKHGRPPVCITAEPRADGGVTVRISDHGEGVTDEQAAELFRPFAIGPRSDSVGLGLWVVNTLATVHGGGVWYEPDGAGRPSFLVELPGASSSESAFVG